MCRWQERETGGEKCVCRVLARCTLGAQEDTLDARHPQIHETTDGGDVCTDSMSRVCAFVRADPIGVAASLLGKLPSMLSRAGAESGLLAREKGITHEGEGRK